MIRAEVEQRAGRLARGLVAVASGFARNDRVRAWEIIREAVKAANAAEGFTGEDGLPEGALHAAPTSEKWFTYLYVNDDKAIKNHAPISPYCDCLCCTRYSVAYLHHLYKINDGLFLRLATMHNLRFMAQLTERLRKEIV